MRSRRGFPTRPASQRSRRVLVSVTALACALATGVAAVAVSTFSASATNAPTVPASFSLSGGGLGHGVGLSQYGAKGQALAGRGAAQIVTYYYTGTTVAPATDNVDLRVDLLHMVSSFAFRSEAIVKGGGTLDVVVGATHVAGSSKNTFTVTNSGTQLTVRRDGVPVASGTSVAVHWSGTDSPGNAGSLASDLDVSSSVRGLSSSGHRYRYGALLVLPHVLSGNTRLEVLNVVNLHNDYLLGVGEMPSSWPAAALQAQAITSRSYALYKYGRGLQSTCLCHLMASSADQAFVGYIKETGTDGSRWRAAVLATDSGTTRALTAQYKGATIEAFFSAATGGRTNNSEDVWGTKVAYLRSVPDPWSVNPAIDPSYAAWSPRIRTQAQVAAVFHLPNVASLDMSNRYASGWLKTVTARSTNGKAVTVSGATFTSALSLPSRWVQRSISGFSTTSPVTLAVDVGRDLYPSSHAAVIANGTTADPVDIFLAAPLAHREKAPLLPVTATAIPTDVRADLISRHVTTVYVVGGPTVVGPAVISALKALHITVWVIAGADPYATSLAVARWFPKPIAAFVVVGGADYAGLTAASGPAAGTGRPILLTKPGAPSAAFVASVRAMAARGSTIVGSTSTVSAAAAAVLPAPHRASGVSATDEVTAVASVFAGTVPIAAIALMPTSTASMVQAAIAAQYGYVFLMAAPSIPAQTRTWLQTHPQTVQIVSALTAVTMPSAAVTAASQA